MQARKDRLVWGVFDSVHPCTSGLCPAYAGIQTIYPDDLSLVRSLYGQRMNKQ